LYGYTETILEFPDTLWIWIKNCRTFLI
jgi:hypothetical protein